MSAAGTARLSLDDLWGQVAGGTHEHAGHGQPGRVRSLAMPKSMTTGRPSTSMTFPGLRSRCTTPAACTAVSAAVSPAARLASDRTVPHVVENQRMGVGLVSALGLGRGTLVHETGEGRMSESVLMGPLHPKHAETPVQNPGTNLRPCQR